ncbi:hypothetical protein [Hugenholtzia roseola]|uniref:hypothetical protein n=1 Tax=Hugenholtzia roseola TaxID=1002 RepID=UPI00041A9DA2|nr:hypothetical protein [Hugenholtzia roseola]
MCYFLIKNGIKFGLSQFSNEGQGSVALSLIALWQASDLAFQLAFSEIEGIFALA